MNLFRTRMFLRIDPLARIHPPYVVRYTRHPRLDPSPLRTPCPVITPEPAILRQMNSRSELRSSYHVSSSITFICHALHCLYDCFVFTVSSPLIVSGRPRCYRRLHRYRVRLRRRRPYPYRRASRQAEPFPSPTYHLLLYIYLLH